jgi:hypothetical protein
MSTRTHTPSSLPSRLAQAWHGLVVTVDAVLSSRDAKGQVAQVERLLKASNACEQSHPARAEALREEASALFH